MAANKQQGSYFGLFLVGSTVLCAGLASFGSGTGKALFVLGAIGLVGSLLGFMGIKSLEGVTAVKPGPAGMKLVGAGVAALGWVVTLLGMHVVASTGGRIVAALVGIGVTLFGIIVVLPAAFNKNAIWKGNTAASERASVTPVVKTSMEHLR